MSDFPLQWHPQWLVYRHGEQGIALISKTDMIWLPFAQFHGIEFIDAKRCDNDIGLLLTKSHPASVGAMFWHLLPKLIRSDLITNNPELQQFYLTPTEQQLTPLCEKNGVELLSMSDNDARWLKGFANTLLEGLTENEEFIPCGKLAVVLVDDFINERIVKLVGEIAVDFQQVMLVEVTAPDLVFTPCFDIDSFAAIWLKVTQRLWENQPIRKIFKTLYPEQSSAFSVLQFDTSISDLAKKWFAQHFAHHCQGNTDSMLFLDLAAFEGEPAIEVNTGLTKAKIVLAASEGFAKQLETPVVLHSCMSVFDSDGGSRSLTPEQTVNRLLPLVNDKVGVITHLQAFDTDTDKDNPIKIYRTAFYKTPTVKQCERFESDMFIQTCMGKGVSSIQSQASALCETIERYNAHFRDDVNLLVKRQSHMESFSACIGFTALLPYSKLQFDCFADADHPDSKLKQAAVAYDDSPVHWLPVWSLITGQKIYVPLSLCFSQVPFDDERFGKWSSNGCAAGNSLEEAILQGLLELIERDAVAIWWYNRSPRQAFDLSRLDEQNFTKLDESLSLSHDYWVLDVTTDIGVAAMVAVGVDKKTGGYILGMGCHISPELAAQRALTELCQLIPIRDQNGAPFDFDAIEKGDYLYPLAEASFSDIEQVCHDKDIRQQINFIVGALEQLNLDVLVLNYSRAHVPLHTAKVFVPGLCHIWPQLANLRLYQTPVAIGLAPDVLNEQQINPLPLYI